MKWLSTIFALTLLLIAFSALSAFAQITPSDDSYTLTSSPTVNFGATNTLLVESAGATTFVRFDLSGIPSTVTGAMVAKATLKIYVSTVTTAGSFNVDLVTSTWAENTISAHNEPTLGSAIASAVPVTVADKNKFVLVDVTAAAIDWLSGTANDGLAIVPDGIVSFAMNSKETTTTSHPPELDIVLTGPAGPAGPISGVTAGAGLTGGGTKGNVTLSLLTTCASRQVLQWNGSTWACSAAGTGTITGVTAGTDLTGGGASGKVTLNLDTTKVPLLAAANTFLNKQSIQGDLNVTSADYQAATVQSSNGFGTWLALGNSSSGHTWNFLTATSGNAEGAGNLGITDLTGASTIWLEGYTNITNNLVVTATPDNSLDGLGAISGYGANGDGKGGVFNGGGPANGKVGGDGVDAFAGGQNTGGGPYAGLFVGDVFVTGEVTGSAAPMRIDHPLDPANKYLMHSAVQSPDMMNFYNGNITTDASGEAIVKLPDWFETLNRDFRYQLTAIGQQAQAWISSEIANRTFALKTDKPNVKISWQVTGIRQDAWANAHRPPVELQKPDREKGFYLHPELYGAGEEQGIAWARNPDIMKRMQAAQSHSAAEAPEQAATHTAPAQR